MLMSNKKAQPKIEPKRRSLIRLFGFFYKFRISGEKEYIIENLYMLLSSGMPVSSALESIKSELHSPYLLSLIARAEEEIESGSTLWQALKNTELFTDDIISFIRIGEESGRLSENLRVIALHEEKQADFKAKFSSALIYPVFVFALTIIIGLGMAWFSLPRLATVFGTLKIKLPLITKLLILFGNFLGTFGFIAVPVAIASIIFLVYVFFIQPGTRRIGQTFLFNIPVIKKIIQQIEIARMGFILGNLLSSGFPVANSLESLKRSTDFYIYKDFYSHLKDQILEGNSFRKSLFSYKGVGNLIPMPIQQMIISGEMSGHLAETLKKIGDIFEEKSEISLKNLPVILEPFLLVVVWVGVVGVAIAVILPLYTLIGNLNNGR